MHDVPQVAGLSGTARAFSGHALGGAALALIVCLGCQTQPEAPVITDEYFFPYPPDPPRIQYLTSLNGSRDFAERKPFLEYLAGAEEPLDYSIEKPFSVATWKGRIYVTDSFGLKGLNVFDLEDRRFYVLGTEPGPGQLRKPVHVFVGDDGLKYVSDLVTSRVTVFSASDDSYVRSYGDGESFLPVACVAHGAEVYVLDIAKDEVKTGFPTPPGEEPLEIRRDQILVLDKQTGRPLRRIGRHGQGQDGFSFASFMSVDRLGNLYISDAFNHRIVKMDPEGSVLASFGKHGRGAGHFAHLKSVAVDRRGIVYVVDAGFQAVQAFDNAGTPLFAMGGPRAPRGRMDLPAGVWIDYENVKYFEEFCGPDFEPEYLILVTNQLSRTHRVSVYAYGKRTSWEYPPEDRLTTLENQDPPLWRMEVFAPDVTSASLEARAATGSPVAPPRQTGEASSSSFAR